MIRLFIGLPLPEAYQQQLATLVRTWRARLRSRISWTRPGNWHVTLKFLGDTQEAALPDIRAALAGVYWSAFTLQAGDCGFFPPAAAEGRASPRVLWVGLKQGASACTQLAHEIETSLAGLGIAPDARPFTPHLTLARVKHAAPDPWSDVSRVITTTIWPPAPAERFVLWQSMLQPQGPEYTQLADFPARE